MWKLNLAHLQFGLLNLGLEPTERETRAGAHCLTSHACIVFVSLALCTYGIEPPTCEDTEPGSQGGKFQGLFIALEADL